MSRAPTPPPLDAPETKALRNAIGALIMKHVDRREAEGHAFLIAVADITAVLGQELSLLLAAIGNDVVRNGTVRMFSETLRLTVDEDRKRATEFYRRKGSVQ